MKLKSLNHVRLFVSPWTVAHQVPLSMGFPRQEYWSGVPFLSPRELLNPAIEPVFPVCPALAGGCFTTRHLGSPRWAWGHVYCGGWLAEKNLGIG